MSTPLVFSYGGGTNSTAMLVGWKERGERAPDLIMFADTGSEKPHTYEHVRAVSDWCLRAGFPSITIVKNRLPQGIIDGSLHQECLRLGALPSKAHGYGSCSLKWKVDPQNVYLRQWLAARAEVSVIQMVGYDADEVHRSEKKKRDIAWADVSLRYPLIEWGWGRDECVDAIRRAGLPQPGKSACFMCPSSTKPEIVELRARYPELLGIAIRMERRALAGEGQAPAFRQAGLGRGLNWETYLHDHDAGLADEFNFGAPEPCGVCMDGDSSDGWQISKENL